ncbi:hypothetical protein C2G38_2227833 [Gigaspora rosea]|uniref:Uncharacterized protein n=1 Tax=Gigaspora rosea TaxID=44941 RepID=A0A397U076_9GLOM|nr:hypothetical protein C2G38_2227833 [Gigaspora rosea]
MNSTQLNNIPKARVNLRDKLKGGTNQKKDYQLDYGINQKRKLENYEDKKSDLLEKADERGRKDETGKLEKELRNIEILKKKDKNLNDYYMIIDKEQIEKNAYFCFPEAIKKEYKELEEH